MTEKTKNLLMIAGFAVIAAASTAAFAFDRPKEPLILTCQSSGQTTAAEDTEETTKPETTKRQTKKKSETTAVQEKEPPQTESVTAEMIVKDWNLNTADSEALKEVDGIGDALAQAIVAYRDAHGGFTRRAELLEISGIGTVLQERILSVFYIPDELPPEEPVQPSAENAVSAETQPQETEIPETTAPEAVRFDLNTVSRDELMQIPGMTDRIADGILALREQFGRFDNIYELALADGMDGAYFEEVLRNYIYVE